MVYLKMDNAVKITKLVRLTTDTRLVFQEVQRFGGLSLPRLTYRPHPHMLQLDPFMPYAISIEEDDPATMSPVPHMRHS